ncbi:MAG TPA: type IV secretion protein IcmD [Gammaproteobacteria bacterium]|nr:type IV secretion protein IcmD [Gammaproteobacteria bacterium]
MKYRFNSILETARHYLFIAATLMAAFSLAPELVAGTTTGIGGLADNVTGNFQAIGNLFIGTAYIAGIGFGVAAIFKFKQHKDNPTQIPIGTPFALLGVSVMLVFLPGLYQPLGQTIYGKTGGTGGGFTGTGAEKIPGGK